MAAHMESQSDMDSGVTPSGIWGTPTRWVRAWRIVAYCLPRWANSGQYAAMGSS